MQPSASPPADITETRARLTSALASALAPLGPFLEDARVVEIMLNADGVVWIDRIGEGMVRTGVRMERVAAEAMLRLVAADVGVQLTASSPALAAKLPPPWAARLQAFLPPVVDAPVFALRKPPRIVFSLPDYLRAAILTQDQSRALVSAIHNHQNILIGGSTGSGRTTFTNALLRVVADAGEAERLYIIEDTPEFQCSAPNKLEILVQPGARNLARRLRRRPARPSRPHHRGRRSIGDRAPEQRSLPPRLGLCAPRGGPTVRGEQLPGEPPGAPRRARIVDSERRRAFEAGGSHF